MKSIWSKILVAIFVLFIAIQFYPYGRDHENPEVTNVIEWDNPQTKEAFYNACADCHSNETTWPWYSNIAPVSWLVQSDVEEGRNHFNISDPNKMRHANDAHEEVAAGEMPLSIYLPLHSEARFDDNKKAKFIAGLKATFNKEQTREEENEESDE
jgi:hypothetical protein